MLIFDYPTKKEMRAHIGQPLRYRETSVFGPEYRSDGVLTGGNRPCITGHKREFFARVHVTNGKITKVE